MSHSDISPEQFHELLTQHKLVDALIIDVREQGEWDYYHLEPSLLMPMNTIPDRLQELPDDKTLYIICAHGVRSAMVCNFLIQQGVLRIFNVQGGMAAIAELNGFQYD